MADGRRRRGRRTRGGRLLAWCALALPFLALTLAYPALRDLPLAAAIEADTLDWRYRLRGPETPEAPVAVVAVDDRTVRAQGGWPVPRDVLGTAVRRLRAAGARVVAIDLLLAEPARDPMADAALAEAMRAAGGTLLPVAFTFGQAAAGQDPAAMPDLSRDAVALFRRAGADGLPRPAAVLAPAASLRAAASGLGHVNVVLGPDGALRQLQPAVAVGGQALPALPLAAAWRFLDLDKDAVAVELPEGVRLGDRRIRLGPDGRWTLRFHGPKGTFPTYALQDVIDGRVPPDAIAGRIVWIGATATAVGDTFVTPFDPALPGVEAFATATANLLADAFLVRGAGTAALDMAAILLVGLLTVRVSRIRPARLAVLATPLPLAAWFAASLLAFSSWGVWLNLTLPALAGGGAAAVLVAWRLLLSEARRQRLAAYVPGPLAEALAAADTPALAGRQQWAAVLFVDLSGFTARSEEGTPADTVAMLRPLHAAFEACAARHGGYVDSFAGDGAMLVFGVPEPDAHDAGHALACAHDLLARADALGLSVRVGVHCGEVLLARLGGERRRTFSLAGDTVNLASRLMEVAKEHGASLAVSGAVADAVEGTPAETGLAGLEVKPAHAIRGRQAPVDVWLGPGADDG